MRSYLLAGACAASMLLALTPAAQAADIDVVPEPMGWNWYVSVFGGWSIPKDEHVSFTTTTGLTTTTVDADIDLDNGFMVGAALGAQFNEWLRGEVEVSGHWHDAGGTASVTTGGGTPTLYSLDGDENALFLLANLWVDLPIGEVIRPYIGGGIGFGRLDVDITATPTGGGTSYDVIEESDWGFAYQLGAGLAFSFTPNMAIDVGYRYKRINNAEFELDDDITGGAEVEIEKDYKSHNILVGLRFSF